MEGEGAVLFVVYFFKTYMKVPGFGRDRVDPPNTGKRFSSPSPCGINYQGTGSLRSLSDALGLFV